MRCINRWSLAAPVLIMVTTAILSHLQRTLWPDHAGPHNAAPSRIGRSSFAAMWSGSHAEGHFNWNHSGREYAPQPHEPDASDTNTAVGAWGRKKPMPFQLWRYCAHHCKSDLNSRLMRMGWSRASNLMDRSIIRRTNVLPGLTTVAACCSCPIRDSSSLFEHLLRRCQDLMVCWRSSSFSWGRLRTSRAVSIWMPRNARVIEGPMTLSGATGTPNASQTASTLAIDFWLRLDVGGSRKRKSSK